VNKRNWRTVGMKPLHQRFGKKIKSESLPPYGHHILFFLLKVQNCGALDHHPPCNCRFPHIQGHGKSLVPSTKKASHPSQSGGVTVGTNQQSPALGIRTYSGKVGQQTLGVHSAWNWQGWIRSGSNGGGTYKS